MASHKTISGIIYRVFNAGAADKLVSIITPKGDKVTILAKGARKPSSRKSSAIEMGNLVRTKVVSGYAVPIMNDIKIEQEYTTWKQSVEKATTLQYMCEIIDKFCQESFEEPDLFTLFKNTLALSITDDLVFLAGIFALKVLTISGNDQIQKVQDVGEVTYGINERIYKTQKFILHATVPTILRVNLTQEEKEKMLKLHVQWLEEVIEKELKSKSILFTMLRSS